MNLHRPSRLRFRVALGIALDDRDLAVAFHERVRTLPTSSTPFSRNLAFSSSSVSSSLRRFSRSTRPSLTRCRARGDSRRRNRSERKVSQSISTFQPMSVPTRITPVGIDL
jgi:hypothetical protein